MKDKFLILKTHDKLRIVMRENCDCAIQRKYRFRWRFINFGPWGPHTWGPDGEFVWIDQKDCSFARNSFLQYRWDQAWEFKSWGALW